MWRDLDEIKRDRLLDDMAGPIYNRRCMKRFKSITFKVTLIILVSLGAGVGLVVSFFALTQNRNLFDSANSSLHQHADILHQSIKNAMLPGEAPIVFSLFLDIQTINPDFTVKLIRSNGEAAFSDNSTIETVNRNLKRKKFQPRNIFLENLSINTMSEGFNDAAATGRTQSIEEMDDGGAYLTIYKPLLNLPKCTGCHGADHTIRGVVCIRSDMTPVFYEARKNVMIAVIVFFGVVILLFLILHSFLQRAVIRPVKQIGHVSGQVTRGDFQARAPVLSNDEIGVLSSQINTMVDGLYERYELSKYVSVSTIESIRNSDKGAKKEMTILFSDIRGFTSFSEQNPPEMVVERLNRILNLQADIIHRHGGDIDKYVGDEIMAVFTGPEKARNACRSALEIQEKIGGGEEGLAGLAVGVGIDMGEVVLGMIGSQRRADFTVIGDHVNFASRLCSEAKSGMVVVSRSVMDVIGHAAAVDVIPDLKIKGKKDPQKVFILKSLTRYES